MQGVPFDDIRKKSQSAEKNPKGGPFGLTCCTFGSIKILWFSARIEPPLSGFRNLVEEDEQQNRWTNCKKWTIQSEIVGWKKTRRDRLKSAPYLRLKNIQRTTIGNIWKNYFFQKKFLKFFFSKKSIFLERRTMPKDSKRGHSGSLNVFTNRKLQKNARDYPLIESENFRKKVA